MLKLNAGRNTGDDDLLHACITGPDDFYTWIFWFDININNNFDACDWQMT